MKITKEDLKKLISEEFKNMAKQEGLDEGAFDFFTKGHEDWEKMAADPEAAEHAAMAKMKTSPPDKWSKMADDIAMADKPRINVERGLDKLLDDFKMGLMALLKPQMTEDADIEATDVAE